MISFPNNLPAFICTEIISYEKPLILQVADYFLAPLRLQTSYEQNSINDEGFPRDGDKTTGFRYGIVKVLIMSPFLRGSLKKIIDPLYLSEFFILTSLTVNASKKLTTYFFKKIDDKGDFFCSKLIKGLALVISASLPIFVGSLGILGLYFSLGSSLPVISLIALGYLALQLSAGALLKVIAYNTNPKVKSAYANYCKLIANNPALKFSKLESEVVDHSNKIEQALTKLENNENLGFLNYLNSDVSGLILSSYLPVQDLIQFRSVNKKLYDVFSTKMIFTQRIKDSFSTDFINKLGIEHILKAMENEPLNPLLVPVPDVNIPQVFPGVEQFQRNVDRLIMSLIHMERNPIAWGHESVQTPKNNSKLFLIFNDVKKSIKLGDFDKYYMISPHDNSEISWEQRSIKNIRRDSNFLLKTTPIYKVDNDRYSIHPLSDLEEEDFEDDTIVKKTDFFKHFKTPETIAHI